MRGVPQKLFFMLRVVDGNPWVSGLGTFLWFLVLSLQGFCEGSLHGGFWGVRLVQLIES